MYLKPGFRFRTKERSQRLMELDPVKLHFLEVLQAMMRAVRGSYTRLPAWRMPTQRRHTHGPHFEHRKQVGDDPTPRKTCTRCGFVNYENPKVVCGSVLTIRGRSDGGKDGVADTAEELIVLGRRTIEPRKGFWGIPAGFLELGETGEEGAAREAREELNAHVEVGGLLAVYSLPHISQIQMIYSSVLQRGEDSLNSRISAGQETDKVAYFSWKDVPWDKLAFPTTSWALWHHQQRTRAPKSGTWEQTGQQAQTVGPKSIDGEHEADAGVIPGCQTAVFSAPAVGSAHFWSPGKGLHLKDGWKVSTDS